MKFAFVASYGRSGSTLLMRMLRQHPGTVIRGLFPYETRTAQYLYAAYRRPGKTESSDLISYKDGAYTLVQSGDPQLLEIVREENALDNRKPIRAARAVYERLADVEEKHDASVAVEKTIGTGLLLEMLEEWEDSRAIFLVRDPRSIYFSVKSFNRKRGYDAFGADSGDEGLLIRILDFLELVNSQIEKWDQRAIVVKYEDLISRPHNVLRPLLSFLDLADEETFRNRMAAVLSIQDKFSEEHATVPLEDSLDRMGDATDEDRALFDKWQKRFAQVGY